VPIAVDGCTERDIPFLLGFVHTESRKDFNSLFIYMLSKEEIIKDNTYIKIVTNEAEKSFASKCSHPLTGYPPKQQE